MSAPNGFCLDQKSYVDKNNVVSILIVDCFILKPDGWNKKILRKPISVIISTTILDFNKLDISEKEIFLQIKDVENFIRVLNKLSVEDIIIKNYEIEEDLIFVYMYKKNSKSQIGEKDHYLNAFFTVNNKLISLAMINYSDKYNNKSSAKNLILEYVNNIKVLNDKK